MSDFIVENGVLIKYTGSGAEVTVPSGITEIGARAFQLCKNLQSVTLSDGVPLPLPFCISLKCN